MLKPHQLLGIVLVGLCLLGGIVLAVRADRQALSFPPPEAIPVALDFPDTVPYETALKSGKPILLEFYADWCLTCRFLSPKLRKFQAEHREQFAFVRLDIDQPAVRSQLKQYGVLAIPQLTLLDSQEKILKTLVGNLSAADLEQFAQLAKD